MPLTDVQCRSAKPQARDYRLPDAGGLHLFVTTAGARLWRLRYKVGGKEKTLSIGPYPEIGLSAARDARDAAKAVLRGGQDPARVKRRAGGSDAFEAVARRWHQQKKPTWRPVHANDVLTSLERDVFPDIGTTPLAGISTPDVLDLLRKVENRGAIETAHRLRQRISAVFVFGIGEGLTKDDPAAVIKGALKPVVKGRQPAVVTLDGVREVLRRTEAEPAHAVTRLALRLLALTSVRPGEIRGATWTEFEIDDLEPVWIIPAERMKMKREHVVPLSRQAVEVLDELRKITGHMTYAFPSARSAHKPMSENAIGYLLNRAGFHQKHVPHGWRAAFSTIMNERRPADRPIIDLMLAHAPKDKVEGAYNRAEHMERRRDLAREWSDILLADMPPAGDLVALPAR